MLAFRLLYEYIQQDASQADEASTETADNSKPETARKLAARKLPDTGKVDTVVTNTGDEVESDEGYTIVEDEDDSDDDGHCIWYGQCGKGFNGGLLNCAATDKTRNPPILTDPKAIEIVKNLCPDFYKGDYIFFL